MADALITELQSHSWWAGQLLVLLNPCANVQSINSYLNFSEEGICEK